MRNIIICLALALVGSICALGDTYLVLPDGTGDFPTVQAAIDAAASGDIVLLGDGIFMGPGNRDITFAGKGIIVQSQGDSPTDCIIDCQASASDRHRGFIFSSQETPSSVLRGVTVRNAYISGGTFPDGDGGGIYCRSASPSIVNCVLTENSARTGAGALCYRPCQPTFTDCVFVRNESIGSDVGAGIYCYFYASPRLVGCNFIGNLPGGVSWQTDCMPELEDCSFSEHPSFGIGCGSGPATIATCLFFENDGPAIRGIVSTASISNCTFRNNHAANGAAVFSDLEFYPVITDCLFYGNTVDQSGPVGYCLASSALEFSNCTIASNDAGATGSVVDCRSGSAAFRNTVLAFNLGAAAVQGYAILSCSDIYGNSGGDWVGDIADQYGVNGNISADPLFCAGESGDFRLEQGSPCAPEYNPDCGLIGALPVGCGGSPAQETTWGALKALFR